MQLCLSAISMLLELHQVKACSSLHIFEITLPLKWWLACLIWWLVFIDIFPQFPRIQNWIFTFSKFHCGPIGVKSQHDICKLNLSELWEFGRAGIQAFHCTIPWCSSCKQHTQQHEPLDTPALKYVGSPSMNTANSKICENSEISLESNKVAIVFNEQ